MCEWEEKQEKEHAQVHADPKKEMEVQEVFSFLTWTQVLLKSSMSYKLQSHLSSSVISLIFFFKFRYVDLCTCVHMSAGVLRYQKKAQDPLQLQSRSSARAETMSVHLNLFTAPRTVSLEKLIESNILLTLFVAANSLCPSRISGTNFCNKAFCTFQIAGGSFPIFKASYNKQN